MEYEVGQKLKYTGGFNVLPGIIQITKIEQNILYFNIIEGMHWENDPDVQSHYDWCHVNSPIAVRLLRILPEYPDINEEDFLNLIK